jgi:hypothetical protein
MSKDIEGTYDAEGWQYASEFKGIFLGREEAGHYVRRRKWIRIQVRKTPSDQTNVKLTPNQSPKRNQSKGQERASPMAYFP